MKHMSSQASRKLRTEISCIPLISCCSADCNALPHRGFAGMIKSAAVAHVVTGVVHSRAALVHTGEKLLVAAQQVLKHLV